MMEKAPQERLKLKMLTVLCDKRTWLFVDHQASFA